MKKLFFVLFIGLGFLGCEKDEPEFDNANALQNLTGSGSKKWRLSAGEAESKSGNIVSLSSSYPCILDNVLTLNVNGTYTMEDLGVQCSRGGNISSVWSYDESTKQIKIGEILILDQSIKDLALTLTDLKSGSFSGNAKNVKINFFGEELSAEEVRLTFVEVK